MGCDHPLAGYTAREFGPSGKRGITFNPLLSLTGKSFPIPCGRCMGCRLEYSRQWAVRCMHEKAMSPDNVFLTLTYDEEHLPPGATLVRNDPVLFLKRLRDAVSPKRFRFYGCGEYGTKYKRPHYHFILFGIDFADKRFYKLAKGGQRLYTSEFIRKYWPHGYNVLGDVDFDSCAYVSRYVANKKNGDMATAHYNGRLPEFSMMSRMPGIASQWFEKYGKHAYQWDSVIMNGREVRPPRFYDTRYEVVDADHLRALKSVRRRRARANAADNTSARRHTKEDLLRLNLKAKTTEF